jgi:hypothetical protein
VFARYEPPGTSRSGAIMRDWHFMEWGWIVVALAIARGTSIIKGVLTQILGHLRNEGYATASHREMLENRLDDFDQYLSSIQTAAFQTLDNVEFIKNSLPLEKAQRFQDDVLKTGITDQKIIIDKTSTNKVEEYLADLCLDVSSILDNSRETRSYLESLVMRFDVNADHMR